jgi:putative alpha-1,2-mannosidase
MRIQIPRVNDTARVGLWTSTLKNNITLQLTSTAHTGIARYTYPSGDRHVLVDLAHVLPSGDGDPFSQHFVSGSIVVNNVSSATSNPTHPSYSGYAEYDAGWNRGPAWRIYFCGTFSEAFNQSTSGVFEYPYDAYQRTAPPPTTIRALNETSQLSAAVNSSTAVGALFSWSKGETIESRIGISFINAKKACDFIAEEAPAHQTFEQTVNKSKALWNGEFLYLMMLDFSSLMLICCRKCSQCRHDPWR